MSKELKRGEIFFKMRTLEEQVTYMKKRKRTKLIRSRIQMVLSPILALIRPIIRYFFYQYIPDTRHPFTIPMGPGGGWDYWERRTQWGRIALWLVLMILVIKLFFLM